MTNRKSSTASPTARARRKPLLAKPKPKPKPRPRLKSGLKPTTRPTTKLRGHVVNLYRETILEAAERVFGRAGFAGAHMADIASEAGIATGSLYTYFDNKERIFQSLLEYRGEVFHARLQAVATGPGPALDRLRALVGECYAFLSTHSAMFALFAELGAKDEWATRRVSGAAAADERCARFQSVFEGVLRDAVADRTVRQDIASADLVAVLSGAMNGLLHDWLRSGQPKDLPRRAELVVDLFLSGAQRGSK